MSMLRAATIISLTINNYVERLFVDVYKAIMISIFFLN